MSAQEMFEELTYFQLSFVEGKIDNIEIFER